MSQNFLAVVDYHSLFMLFVGAVVGLLLGVPTKYIGNVVLEPRREVEYITWSLIPIIAVSIFALHKFEILEMKWIPFLVGVFVARGILLFLIEKRGLVSEKMLRLFYFLRLWKQPPYKSCILPKFVQKTLAQRGQTFDGLAYAVICARLSHMAYQDSAAVSRLAEEWGWSSEYVEKDNMIFITLHDSTSIFVAFRGTDFFELKDWLINADIRHHKVEWGQVHAGFNSATVSLWPDLARIIQETHIRNPNIWLTGHSLGGALAVISAMKLAFSDIGTPAGVVTFGQPAVGDSSFCREFDNNLSSQALRFVNCNDEIPNQPPGFFHAGGLKYFDRKGGVHSQPKKSFIWVDQFCQGTRGPFEDHSMLLYLRLIESILVYGVGAHEKLNQDLWEAWGRLPKGSGRRPPTAQPPP